MKHKVYIETVVGSDKANQTLKGYNFILTLMIFIGGLLVLFAFDRGIIQGIIGLAILIVVVLITRKSKYNAVKKILEEEKEKKENEEDHFDMSKLV